HILAEVVKGPIDLSPIPPGLRELLARCLDRDPRTRLRDIGEARLILSKPLETPRQTAADRSFRLPWIAAAVCALAAAGGWWQATRPTRTPELVRANLNLPEGMQLSRSSNSNIAISPDGSRLVLALESGGISRL